jgi:hypothetical protein
MVHRVRGVILGVCIGAFIASCGHGQVDRNHTAAAEVSGEPRSATLQPTNTQPPTTSPSTTHEPSPTPTPSPTAFRVGPTYLEKFNPLTGELVDDESHLYKNPILVSVTNFPPSARPQAGLSAASHVWEISIGQGMTRFLAVYYGDYADELLEMNENRIDQDETYVVGPVRSGRIPYQEIKLLYPSGRLYIRYASPEVLEQLSGWETVHAQDPNNVNSAGIFVEDLDDLSEGIADPGDLSGLVFDSLPMTSGVDAEDFTIVYNYFNLVGWSYDPPSGVYVRSQDLSIGEGELFPAVERMTGEQLQFENVLVLFAQHKFENLVGTILDIELQYLTSAVGYLLRDGKMQEIRWSTRSANLALWDLDGNVMPLKHGRTFFEMLSYESTWDSDGRVFRFHSPPLPTLTPTTTPTTTPTPSYTPSP